MVKNLNEIQGRSHAGNPGQSKIAYDQLAYTKEVPIVNNSNIERNLIGGCRKFDVKHDAAFEKQDSTYESVVPQKKLKICTVLTIFP